MSTDGKAIGIVGSGLIGRNWALLFVSAGYPVYIYDCSERQLSLALDDIFLQLTNLESQGLLRGQLSAQQQFKLVFAVDSLSACASGVQHVQECVPEQLELKKQLFEQLDQLAREEVVLASSTSCIAPSRFTEQLEGRRRCLVAHPVNPPYHVPLVELVPSPWTEGAVVDRTRQLMLEIGQAPVTLTKEMPGFALNRIQYAILNECWRLVSEKVLSVQDVDTVMTSGLGPRYAFIGPLETAHLNAEGIQSYSERYGSTIHEVSQTLGAPPIMQGAQVSEISRQLQLAVPLDQLQERRKWRDARLAALAKLKSDMKS